jgi:hypothetical protein
MDRLASLVYFIQTKKRRQAAALQTLRDFSSEHRIHEIGTNFEEGW